MEPKNFYSVVVQPKDYENSSRAMIFIVHILALAVHLQTVLLLCCLCILPFLLKSYEEAFVKLYHYEISSMLFFICALLHLHGLFLVLRSLFGGKKQFKSSVLEILSYKLGCSGIYSFFFNPDHRFGRRGRDYELRLAFRQAIGIPIASYQAYLMSNLLSNHVAAMILPVLIFLNAAILLPYALHLKSTMTCRRTIVMCDAIFDFCFSAGVPLILIVLKMYALYVRKQKELVNDAAWSLSSVLDIKQFLITSLLDLLTTIPSYVFSFLSLRCLVAIISDQSRVKPCQTKSSSSSCTKKGKLGNIIGEVSVTPSSRLKKVLSTISFAWGTSVLFISWSARYGEVCPSGCRLQVYPWFNNHCECIVYELDCQKQSLSERNLYDRLTNISESIMYLEISQCNLPSGPNLKYLSRLKNLGFLKLFLTNMSNWRFNENKLPGELIVLDIRGTHLSAFPEVLSKLELKSLRIFILNYSSISTLPPHLIKKWPKMERMYLQFANFSEIPSVIFHFPGLKRVSFLNNRITSLPVSSSHSNLEWVDLSYNKVYRIRTNLSSILPRLKTIFLQGNPIKYLDASFVDILPKLEAFTLGETIICDKYPKFNISGNGTKTFIQSFSNSICSSMCKQGCLNYTVGNNICQLECHNKECNWDNGDCDRYGIQNGTKYLKL